MIPWWAIIIGIVAIVLVLLTVRGWVIARRCRRMMKKENVKLPANHNDEDSESGDSDAA